MDKFVIKRKRDGNRDATAPNPAKRTKEEPADKLSPTVATEGLPCHKCSISEEVSEQCDTTRVLTWRRIRAESLNCDYTILFGRSVADQMLKQCEAELEYYTGQLAQVQVFGKWHNIHRKQVAHGSAGLHYTFSGKTLPSKPWTPFLENIRDQITKATGHSFNFVLINRYKDGSDFIGEHRDDEKELEYGCPIASLTLGQSRDFVFRHWQSRGKNATRKVAPVTVLLEHGGLLMMNHPTNTYWYHSLPVRKRAPGVRINMTFRKMNKLALKNPELQSQ